MKREGLVLLNSAGLLALLAAGALALLFGERPAPRESDAAPRGHESAESASIGSAQGGEVALLRAELARLQARVVELEALAAGSASAAREPARRSGAAGEPELDAPLAEPQSHEPPPEHADATPPTRAEVRALVVAELEARAQRQAQRAREAAAQAQKPKRTLREVSQELQLTPQQTQVLRSELRRLEGDAMRVFFGLAKEADLTELAARFEQAKHDPAVKEALRQEFTVNWAKNQGEFWALFAELDGRLRKELPKDTLQRYYGFEVRLDEPRFPDLREFFKEEEKQ